VDEEGSNSGRGGEPTDEGEHGDGAAMGGSGAGDGRGSGVWGGWGAIPTSLLIGILIFKILN
jgi:hypothetical protein